MNHDDHENAVLIQLREARTELKGIRSKLEEHDRRFDGIDNHFGDMQLLVNQALGLGTANQVKIRDLEARQRAGEAWQVLVDERCADFEHRLGSLEDKIGR